MEKRCTECGEVRLLTDFPESKRMMDGRRNQCNSCRSKKAKARRAENPDAYNRYMVKWRAKNPEKQHAINLKREHKITIEQYNDILSKQNCKCAICGNFPDPSKKRGMLCVDHDHSTGKLRGLLCQSCNKMLGFSKDNVEILVKGAEYLKRYR